MYDVMERECELNVTLSGEGSAKNRFIDLTSAVETQKQPLRSFHMRRQCDTSGAFIFQKIADFVSIINIGICACIK